MLKCPFSAVLFVSSLAAAVPAASVLADATEAAQELDEITVRARRVANTRPAGTYATAATALRYDPLTELQPRGLAEGQSDVTVRGGVFENTGFKIGAVTVMDPQTGHYVAGLPIDPALMSAPAILKGIDGAVEGFNSAIATVAYRPGRVAAGGEAVVGAGSDRLRRQGARVGYRSDTGLGLAVSVARSAGDGTQPNGDHEFSRYNLQLQRVGEAAQTDLIFAYQDKFYGWPGAYTGFSSLAETDDTQTTLALINHRRTGDSGWVEYGAYYRRLVDDYDFNRFTFETGIPGAYEHETRVAAAGIRGLQRTGRLNWRYGGQLSRDELVRSTDLTQGEFTDRTYATASVVASSDVPLASGPVLTWRAGLTVDYSNRDASRLSPLAGLSLVREGSSGATIWSVEYAETSQLPGYTALNSPSSGLFGGNSLLGREVAEQWSFSVTREQGRWRAQATLFLRHDDDLVDWTFATDAPFVRQANAVDLDVRGFEVFFTRGWRDVDLAAGYTWLHKDADYGGAEVDASFYALNFARHRATAAARYRFAAQFELRFDAEYRRQEENPLRNGDDTAFLASAALEWTAMGPNGFRVALVADNLTDSEFQTFPGTPAYGRQYSLNLTYAW